MRKLVVALPEADVDRASALFFELGAGAVEELDEGLATYGEAPELERLRAALAAALPGAEFRMEELDDAWRTAWTDYLRPEPLGTGFVFQPASNAEPAPEGRRTLVYEPRAAFGTGGHPTTRLAAALVERYVREHPGARVLDVGTGSGVLALIAAACGAAGARGLDLDAEAVRAARANARLNGLERVCRFEVGSLTSEVEAAELVVANLDAATLIALAPALARAARPGGVVAGTGLLAERASEVERALAAAGLAPHRQTLEDGWCLVELLSPRGERERSKS
ncbi:MAG: 50S ribosomal protein L11 methyltransferase [Sorangiineae bacterium]|nr:50S ribosomal protein L11 methyltransferase [Polyangiaceae bacterium]MEB2324419.1 50S ribosomal protein L11 methyltransferase [Sorangiineae bacterium]